MLFQVAEDDTDQALIHIQNRGGLTAVNTLTQKIFVKTEQMFRRETCDIKIKKIDTKGMVARLMKDPEIISIFNTIAQDAEADANENTRHVVLKMMCSLYLRVKAFGLAKKITTNYRIAHRASKAKALRKALKQKCSTINEEQ